MKVILFNKIIEILKYFKLSKCFFSLFRNFWNVGFRVPIFWKVVITKLKISKVHHIKLTQFFYVYYTIKSCQVCSRNVSKATTLVTKNISQGYMSKPIFSAFLQNFKFYRIDTSLTFFDVKRSSSVLQASYVIRKAKLPTPVFPGVARFNEEIHTCWCKVKYSRSDLFQLSWSANYMFKLM